MNNEIRTVKLAAELTAAWLANPSTRTDREDIPAFLTSMYAAVSDLSSAVSPISLDKPNQKFEPAVTAQRSLASPDHILSLINGEPYKILRRHLKSHGLTPAEYRSRYNLSADYPMVAPSYSNTRRVMAKSVGLGLKSQKSSEKIDIFLEAPRKPRARKTPKSPTED
ncbi:MucR family transcriptional regulator [Sphingomonas sp. R86520]|uniref:MucR family transcriptional regulator n=1 Tax=Sphingomonas sp. R86520 TaxID=3093859 RepID=UPI0036D363B8